MGLTYYLDGSDDAISDPDSAWSNEANVTDANYANYATCGATGSKTSNYLLAGGTDAPTSGDAITGVKARIYAYPDPGQTVSTTIYTDGLAEELGSVTKSGGSAGFSSYVDLSVPTGGWTWEKIAALEAKIYATAGQWAHYVQFDVGVDQLRVTKVGAIVEMQGNALYVTKTGVIVEFEPEPAPVLNTLKASGASTSAGSAVLHMGMSLAAAGASTSAGTAIMSVWGAGQALVTQAGALVDVARTVPVNVTQAGANIDVERTSPVNVTQAGLNIDVERTSPVNVTQAGLNIDVEETAPLLVTQAGLMVDARYRRPENTYNCWEFHVYRRDGTYLAYLDNAFQTAYLEQLNECGGGSFVLPANDAKATAANLATGNVVRPRYRNVEIGAFSIEDVEEVLVGPGEGQDQLLRVSGRGLIGTLDHAVVYPGSLADPATAERVFSSEAKAAIWLALYNEFVNRGGGDLDMGFTGAVDSAGLAWGDTISINFRAGQTLLDVLRQLTSLGMDVVVDPDRTVLAYKTLGRDLSASVVFRKGHNVLASTKKTLGSDLANAVLGAGQDVLAETTDATSQATYGRREVYLPVQNTSDAALVAAANALLLAEYKNPRTAITLEVTAIEVFPFFDYDIGDTVRVVIPEEDGTGQEIDADYRIFSISIREGQGPCDLRVTLELNSLEAEYLIKLQKALRASLLSVPPSSGSAASLASSTTATPATSDGTGLEDDAIKSKHVDWGTGVGQVSAADVPIADVGTHFATDNVEAALQELGPLLTPQSGTGEATGFVQGSGSAVNDASTFTGNVGSTAYRVNDIVKALKNLGFLAT
jgi:hypothetical protein